MRVVGVVLAAGESRRMGQFKALLPFGAQTVIERILHVLCQAELAEVAVVLGHRAAEIAAVVQALPVRILHNPDYRLGMTSSVQAACRALLPVPDAYLLALVDQPQLQLSTVQSVLHTARQTHKGLVIPTYNGKRGHPILLSSRYRDAVLALGPEQGLNLVTRGYPDDTQEIPMPNDDTLRDMDYPQEYEAELRRLKE